MERNTWKCGGRDSAARSAAPVTGSALKSLDFKPENKNSHIFRSSLLSCLIERSPYFIKAVRIILISNDVITFMHQRGTRPTSRWEHEGGGSRRGRNVSSEIRSNSDTFPQLMSIPLCTYVSYRFSTQWVQARRYTLSHRKEVRDINEAISGQLRLQDSVSLCCN